jgi:hypothetical protein
VLSHPFARKKAKGWGTEHVWINKSGNMACVDQREWEIRRLWIKESGHPLPDQFAVPESSIQLVRMHMEIHAHATKLQLATFSSPQ